MSRYDCFLTPTALAINQARREHLTSLGLPLNSKSVLEVGAGIGLHTQFFLDRSCEITITDGREDNVQEIRRRWPHLRSLVVDLDHDTSLAYLGQFDMIYCYGLLYHLADPEGAIRRMADICQGQILLELICNTDITATINFCDDPSGNNQSTAGKGCRPSRAWVLQRLRQYFGYAYISVTQPNHPEFPLDWIRPTHGNTRAVFVGSKQRLENPFLAEKPLDRQKVCYNLQQGKML